MIETIQQQQKIFHQAIVLILLHLPERYQPARSNGHIFLTAHAQLERESTTSSTRSMFDFDGSRESDTHPLTTHAHPSSRKRKGTFEKKA
jgi:hypothetical protein